MCSHRKLSESDLKDTIITELREKMKGGRKNKPERALELMDPHPAPPLQSLRSPLLCPNPEKPFHLEREKGQRDHFTLALASHGTGWRQLSGIFNNPTVKWTSAVLLALQSIFSELRPVSQANRDGGHSGMSNNRVYGKH